MAWRVEDNFREFIGKCLYRDRGWVVNNVVARSLHIPHLALTVLSASLNTTLGLGYSCLSLALLGRVKKFRQEAKGLLEPLKSFLPHIYNDILGLVNPSAAFSSYKTRRFCEYGESLHDYANDKIGRVSLGASFQKFYKEDLAYDWKVESLEKRLLCKSKSVGFFLVAVAIRTAELALAVLLTPLDVLALGSYRSLHNLVVRGLEAPAIIRDFVICAHYLVRV